MKTKRIKILLLEDEAAHAEAIRRALESADAHFDIQVVGSLSEYRESIAVNQPDIALLDIMLPDGNTVTLLNSQPEANAFPFIILTSHGDEQTAVSTMKLGALDYIVKSPEAFANTPRIVSRALSQWHLLQEHKRMEEALRESEARLTAVVMNAPIGIATSDAEHFLTANAVFCKILGYTEAELQKMMFKDITYPEDLGDSLLKMADLDSGRMSSFLQEKRYIKKDGSVIIGRVIVSRIYKEEGLPHVYVAELEDITERKQAEAKLKESEERFKAIFDNVNDGIMVVDLNTQSLYRCNKVMWEMLGYRPEEAGDLKLPDIHTEQELPLIEKRIEKGIALGVEKELKRKDGSILYTEVTPSYISFRGRKYLVGIFRDITERKQLEKERQRAAKLDSVGTLAGGIAHDFNNLLTGIIGNISLAKSSNEAHEEVIEALDEAEKASFRARDLTQQLLTFSRGGEPLKKLFDISKILIESANFALRGSSVRVEFVLPDDLWMIEADEGQISQVINNLVINAVQSMPQGGIIKISARNQIVKESNSSNMAGGNYVHISIEDHGIGIPKEHQSRIFEPYFTTKQKGSGLGLATSYSIIKKHQGYISFNSELGKGTTFHIELPASKKRIL